MCGIAGYVSLPECDRSTLSAMTAAIAHRGPDDEGIWCAEEAGLAYRRLAIIDLTAAGNQPVVSQCGRYVMVYNGEIYNYLELRRELVSLGISFRSHSDSEVLLAAFIQWGEAGIARLNGMWAFAIWDKVRRRLFASRDRFGKKPLYYCRRGRGLMFASEVKALLATRLVAARPDLQAVADFAAERVTDHRAQSFFEGIEQVRPGHHLTWDGGQLEQREYWRADKSLAEIDSSPVSPEEIRELLVDAVRVRLRADTPVGLLLSGGLDSSAVSCIAASLLGSEISTFSTVDQAHPVAEAEGIEHVRGAFPTIRIYRDSPDRNSFLADLDNCLWHQEEPFADGSMVAHFRLMRMAREAGVRVLLTGQGADETFAGYSGFLAVQLADLARSDPGSALSWLSMLHRTGERMPLAAVAAYMLPRSVRFAIRQGRSANSIDWLVPQARHISAQVNRGLAFRNKDALRSALVDCIQTRTLPGFLHYDDRNSMAHGVETRLPFLDFRLAERVLNVPGRILLEGAKSKALLRKAVVGIVPAPIINRLSKQGYPAPIERWLREADEVTWAGWFDAVKRCPLILESAWREHQRAFIAGDNSRFPKVWRGLVLSLWHRKFIAP